MSDLRLTIVVREMWVDFQRTDGEGLTHAHVSDAAPGVEVRAGRHLVVWDEGADDAVGEIVQIEDDGVVLVRVLSGPAEEHLGLIQGVNAE
ncbi:MAG: hypothetical protein NVSMB4_00930 [Acidimicrobiales bacterium]